MAKIPTFEATVAPTAEVGAVKSNIQVSPKSSLAGALLPAADAITQFYVKEKEISNKVEGGQLIADANQELLEIKEKAKLKATPDEGVNFFNAGYKQVVDKYKSKASNNYIQRYFDLNIASNKPSYINNILKQTRANMVKTRVDQVSREVSNEITTAVENKNTFNFAVLSESITSKYQGLVNDGLISEADLEIYKRQLPALVETEMVRKIANEDAFAALVSLDDPKNYSSITGEDRLKLKKELRELSTFQKNIVDYTVSSEGLKYKKKVSEALQGNKSTAILGIKPDELSLYYSTGNQEFDNQITELNNKVINNQISKDNNYLTNDKIIKKILNNEIKHPFEKFLLPGETEAKSITERVGDGSINLDDDNFFNNIFENQQNPELIKANKEFFNFMDKVIPLIEGSVSSKYFDENYNNRLSSFRQDMHSKFIDGIRNNIPVAKLLDSTSDNYIAKDILDYTPTKSAIRDALLTTAKKEGSVLVNTFFKKKVDETPSDYINRITEFYVKEDGEIGQRKKKEVTKEDVMKGSVLDEETDNEFNFLKFFSSDAEASQISMENEDAQQAGFFGDLFLGKDKVLIKNWNKHYQTDDTFVNAFKAKKRLNRMNEPGYKIPNDAISAIENAATNFDGDRGFSKETLIDYLTKIGQIESQYETKIQRTDKRVIEDKNFLARSYWQIEVETAKDILKNSAPIFGNNFESTFSKKYKGKYETAREGLLNLENEDLVNLLEKDDTLAANIAAALIVTRFNTEEA